MSRIAKSPIDLPKEVDLKISDGCLVVKGIKGILTTKLPAVFQVSISDGKIQIFVEGADHRKNCLAGTVRANIANMVAGVSHGFERKLVLIGVGYRAQMKGEELNLSLGYSHPINVVVPSGVTIETPSQTEIIVRGCDRQQVGQIAANLRSYRPPEPYKGKGIRYSDEIIIRKEAKKK